MKPPFEPSVLVKVQGEHVRLSGPALLDLMRTVLSKGKPFRFQAPGNSMHPFIRNGDILTLTPVTAHLRVGDNIAFIHPGLGRVVVHRIIRINNTSYLTRGDATPNGANDGWVPFDLILGRVERINRKTKEIHFGLGPERLLIAFLSSRGWLLSLQSNPVLRLLGKWVLR